MKKFFLITGSAGFIGFHLSKKLLDKGFNVVGVDNINSYYDKSLKLNRLKLLKKYKNFIFFKIDIIKIVPAAIDAGVLSQTIFKTIAFSEICLHKFFSSVVKFKFEQKRSI